MDGKIITKIKVKISNHGRWDNQLELEGDYEAIVKPELDRFYEQSRLCMEKEIEYRKVYNESLK